MDRGAWQTTAHGFAKSWTWCLSDFNTHGKTKQQGGLTCGEGGNSWLGKDVVIGRLVLSYKCNFETPWTKAHQSPRVSCHALLQGIFLTQGSNPCLLHFLLQWILYLLSHLGNPTKLKILCKFKLEVFSTKGGVFDPLRSKVHLA